MSAKREIGLLVAASSLFQCRLTRQLSIRRRRLRRRRRLQRQRRPFRVSNETAAHRPAHRHTLSPCEIACGRPAEYRSVHGHWSVASCPGRELTLPGHYWPHPEPINSSEACRSDEQTKRIRRVSEGGWRSASRFGNSYDIRSPLSRLSLAPPLQGGYS